MFEFIKLQYQMGRISKEQVLACVPQWLTAEQAKMILGGGTV